MTTLVLTRGLPASGKTTWARVWVNAEPNRVRVNRDDLRMNLFGAPWLHHEEEKIVTIAQYAAVRALLIAGQDVVVDDTNLRRKFRRNYADIAVECGAQLLVLDFDASLEECMKRDSARERVVGENVIREMYKKFFPLKSETMEDLIFDKNAKNDPGLLIEPYVSPNKNWLQTWIFDIDGTIALMGDKRGPFEEDKVLGDDLNIPVVKILKSLSDAGYRIILMSGRTEGCRNLTEDWLTKWAIPRSELLMRKAGDQRQDSVVKLELFNIHLRYKYNIVGVVDDRMQVVNLWRSLGLMCAQVAPGRF